MLTIHPGVCVSSIQLVSIEKIRDSDGDGDENVDNHNKYSMLKKHERKSFTNEKKTIDQYTNEWKHDMNETKDV